LLAACNSAQGEPTAAPRGAAQGLVVLELFTSQGCSSCPPADRLLSSLISAGKLADRKVVPMSFHVDYWNDLGWADPFSRPQWTQRQRAYASSLSERGVYTPQLVIGGRAHVVGSDRKRLEKAVASAASTTPLTVTATWSGQSLDVNVAEAVAGDTELWVAVWQDGLTTKVARGENRGEALRNDHVVRRLTKLSTSGTGSVALDPQWRNLGGIVFAQRSDDRAIIAAAELPAPPTR
jgi:hypothetical protein